MVETGADEATHGLWTCDWKNCTDLRFRSLNDSKYSTYQRLINRRGEVGVGEKGRRGADQIQMWSTLLVDLSIFKVVPLMKTNHHLLILHYLSNCNSITGYVTRLLLDEKEKILLTAVPEEISLFCTWALIPWKKLQDTHVAREWKGAITSRVFFGLISYAWD